MNINIDLQSSSRRQLILNEMQNLANNNIGCANCQGPCCTFEANSMQITVLEAIEIIQYLKENNRIDSKLISKLQKTIANYRLDSYQGTGKTTIRKSYTCPFFNETTRKCTISRQSKPIGCLGFNPIESGITNGGTCKSNLELLKIRENDYLKLEKELNTHLKNELGIFWEKAPIPVAVLEVLNASSR